MDLLLVVALIALAFAVLVPLAQRNRRRAIERHDFGSAADARLGSTLPKLTREQRAQVWQGLREFFEVCRRARGRRVPMPSKAIDSAWHAFLVDTVAYGQFCQRAFGRLLHHYPAPEGHRAPEHRIAVGSWNLAYALSPPQPGRALPLMFTIDETLGIEGGYRYELAPRPRRAEGAACGGGGCSGGTGGCEFSSGACADSASGCSGGCGGGGD